MATQSVIYRNLLSLLNATCSKPLTGETIIPVMLAFTLISLEGIKQCWKVFRSRVPSGVHEPRSVLSLYMYADLHGEEIIM